MGFYTLSEEFTPIIRRGRRPIVSPDDGSPSVPPTNLNNAFAAIPPSRQPDDSDNDDEQSNQGTTQSVLSNDDSDYGINAMTIIQRKEITDLMTRVIPVTEPTMIDLQSFRKKVANSLFTQKARGVKTGHAWLVETEAGHKTRTGDPVAVLPKRPPEPIEPAGSTVSNAAYNTEHGKPR